LKEIIKEVEKQEEKQEKKRKLEKEAEEGEQEQERLKKLEYENIGRASTMPSKRVPPQITSKFTTIPHSPSSIKIISKTASYRNSTSYDLHQKELSQTVLLHYSSKRNSKEQKRRSTGSSHKSEEEETIPEPLVSADLRETFRPGDQVHRQLMRETEMNDSRKTNTITDLFRVKLATTKSELPEERRSLERDRNSLIEEELPPKPSLLSGFIFFGKYKFR